MNIGWGIFAVLVVGVLAIDLGLLNRNAKTVSVKSAAFWSAVWVALGLGFNAYIWATMGTGPAMQFTQAWLLEYALSVDNVFVFLVIFGYFKVPENFQHRVLFWGILGAVVTRGLFVGLGAALITRFHWVMYLLGAFLIFTSIKLFTQDEGGVDPSKSPFLRLFRKLVPCTDAYHGAQFFVREGTRTLATPLLAVLVVVEATDVMFAVDSIPACFGVTTDVYIVYTSNIFAILGLRSLFFLVSGLMGKLHLLNYGVAVILGFIGVKILVEPWWAIPVSLSLGFLALVLTLSTVLSFVLPAPPEKHVDSEPGGEDDLPTGRPAGG